MNEQSTRSTPWPIPAGIAMLAVSLVPAWLLDLSRAPLEFDIRFWTTLFVAVALAAIARRVTLFRWLLLVLLGTGVAVSVWSFVVASVIEVESALITVVQAIGLGLLFTPRANRWFKQKRSVRQP